MKSHRARDAFPITAVAGKQGTRTLCRAAPWLVIALACTAEFMVVLDISVVNIALPSIQAALGFEPINLQWVVNGYALVFAGFLLFGGRLADLYGCQRIFIVGLALFTASSLSGGLASTPGILIAARAVQGLSAAILTPTTLAILTTRFPEGTQRTRALALWTAAASAGGAAGNIIGGLLTQFLSWRWILLVNVPVGMLVALLAVLLLSDNRGMGRERRLDPAGAFTATLSFTTLTYGITQTQSLGWSDPITVAALATGIVTLTVFILIEAQFAHAPIMPLHLFHVRTISVGNVVMLLAGACFMPMWYFLTLFMQNVLHYTPLQTGVGFLPHTLMGVVIGVSLAPWMMRYIAGRTLITVGALVAAAGFLWQSRITPHSNYLSGVLGPAILISAGGGLLNTPITATVTSGTSASEAGAAAGLMNTAKQIGGAFGLATLIAVADSNSHIPAALAAGYGRAFLTIAAILVLAAAVSLALPARRDA